MMLVLLVDGLRDRGRLLIVQAVLSVMTLWLYEVLGDGRLLWIVRLLTVCKLGFWW